MTEPPRAVLVLHASDELYGSDRVLLDVLTRLDPDRLRPLVVLPDDVPGGGALSTALDRAGIEVERQPLAVLRRRYLRPDGLPLLAGRLLADRRRLSRMARQRGVALVYSNTVAVQAGGLVARRLGLPHVWHVHEIVERPAAVARLLRASLRANADRRIAISRAVADWIDLPGTRVIHNGIAEPRLDAAERAAHRRELLAGRAGPLVGWVNRVSAWKGQGAFVAFARRAAARWPDAVFVLAGGAPTGSERLVADLRRELDEDSAGGRVRYLGPAADGPRLIGALDVLVACPTRPEPLGRVAQEALWHGIPVLAVRSGGLPELVRDGITGVLVDDPGPEALVAGLAMLADDSRRRRMGEAAREDAAARFGVDAFVRQVEEELLAALDEAPVSRPGPRR
jgi:glycosyltransferase involved in cell wall biosynthesis